MKKFEDLPQEVQNLIPEWREEMTKGLYDGTEYDNWKREDCVAYIEHIYSVAKKQKPVVIIANNPTEYKKFYNLLMAQDHESLWKPIAEAFDSGNTDNHSFEEMLLNTPIDAKDIETGESHWTYLLSEYSRIYLLWYKFVKEKMGRDMEGKEKDLDYFHSMVKKASISKVYLSRAVCLVLRMPKYIRRNEQGFHSAEAPSLEYPNGDGWYYLNGRHIPDWVFEDYNAGTLTLEKFQNEDNEDIRAGIVTLIKEREGEEGFMDFLNAELVDEKMLVHEQGYTETISIYKTKDKYPEAMNQHRDLDQPYAWVRMQCPSTGQTYLISTCPTFTDAKECIKWHRPDGVPMELNYLWMSAN